MEAFRLHILFLKVAKGRKYVHKIKGGRCLEAAAVALAPLWGLQVRQEEELWSTLSLWLVQSEPV